MSDEEVVFIEWLAPKSGIKRPIRQNEGDSIQNSSSSLESPGSLRNDQNCKRRKTSYDLAGKTYDRRTEESVRSPVPIACGTPSTIPKRNSKKSLSPGAESWLTIVDLTFRDGEEQLLNVENKSGQHYIPNPGSVARDMLVALARKDQLPGYRGYMLKLELINEAQEIRTLPVARKSLKISRCNAVDSIKKLIKRNLMIKRGKPAEFRLTDEGRKIAVDIIKFDSNYKHGQAGASVTQLFQELTNGASTAWSMEPNSFEIVLYVDAGELIFKNREDELLGELKMRGVNAERRKLYIGDFVWVARSRRIKSHELVLPYIVERKRMDDLAGSLKDGRLQDQQSRLIKTGLTVVIILEEYSRGKHVRGFEAWKAVSKAKSVLEQVEGLVLEKTTSLKDTVRHLAHMSSNFVSYYQNKSLKSCPIEEWAEKKSCKDQIFLQMFSDMNLHGARGCS